MSDFSRTDPLSAAARLLNGGHPVDAFVRAMDDDAATRVAKALARRFVCQSCYHPWWCHCTRISPRATS